MKTDSLTKALIIDDDIDMCFLLNRILSEKNIESLYVNTLKEAKTLFETFQPLLIFLDNNLPDGFGLEFIPVVKEKFPKVQIIMITGHDVDLTRRNAIENGIMFFIPKPFKSDEIHHVISSIVH